MAKIVEARSIGGHTFKISQLPAKRALEMFGRLGRALGPAAFEALAKGSKILGDDMEADIDLVAEILPALAPSLATLFDRLPPGELTGIADVLLEPALCDGVPLGPQFEEVFQGNILLLLKTVAFAVEVNYRDFFDAGKGLLGRRKEKAAAALKDGSPT